MFYYSLIFPAKLINSTDPELKKIFVEQAQKQNLRDENKEHTKCHQAFKTSNYEQFKDINPERVRGTCR